MIYKFTFVRHGWHSVDDLPESSAGTQASVELRVEARQTAERDTDVRCV